MTDRYRLGDRNLGSRLWLGTSRYPSPSVLAAAVRACGTEIVTVSLRRASPESGGGDNFWRLIRELGVFVLPNTAGCRGAREAVTTAMMAREIFATSWIKIEITGDDDSLRPDPFETVEAARILIREGFDVFPYTTEDPVVADRLVDAGCRVLMPWASPIGSAQGPVNPVALRALRRRHPDIFLVVDAGLGRPSHAAAVMEWGYDACLLNTAVALAEDPEAMARAFRLAVEAGRAAHRAVPLEPRPMASPSTPISGAPFR